ncbi:enediyne biosynthesis thioesterase [Micromonospora profundi]|uniref:acyl-CoA thioesterase n=1 Tax=Micromonospora profundi TaxID=1420889 RepID=UPI00143B6047|nr:acyl-CoA thioesterase [Micromonospora profundi]NJC11461.1 enediyne biosynthesis thioesterase [Micromonospora profundi]
MRKQYFEYRHVVGFDETNLLGTVYDVNYIRWQGQCREMFLLKHAPDVLDELSGDLVLRCVESEAELLADVSAFDEVAIRMRLEELTLTQIRVAFDVVRMREGREDVVARSRQRVMCLRVAGGDTTPAQVPPQLGSALEAYAVASVGYPVGSGTGGRA